MFGFQVINKFDESEAPRSGSVVTVPLILGCDIVVGVMWDDDLTFETMGITELQAVRYEPEPKEPDENIEGDNKGKVVAIGKAAGKVH